MKTPEQRFHAKYAVAANGCWIWTASLMPSGYAQFHYGNGKNGYGHRFAYELIVGEIPEGMQLHHTCETKACVNPGHLELVTPRIHLLERNDTPARRNAEKTHCKRGHPLSGENVYEKSGRRICRACQKIWRDEHREEIREYSRVYFHKRYADDSDFRKKHQERARAAASRRRAGANPDPPDLI